MIIIKIKKTTKNLKKINIKYIVFFLISCFGNSLFEITLFENALIFEILFQLVTINKYIN